MKTKILSLTVIICLSLSAHLFGQIREIDLDHHICTFDIGKIYAGRKLDLKPSNLQDNVLNVVETINRLPGVDNTNYKVYKARGLDNAFATRYRGSKWIVVDLKFLSYLNRVSNTKWAAISVIAHEVGHHIHNHISQGSNRRAKVRQELEADEFSGYVLARLGAGKASSIRAVMATGTSTDTGSHPSKYKRRQAIESGWERGKQGSSYRHW